MTERGPGVPANSHGWRAGEEPDDVVIGPLPELQKFAGQFAEALSATEWLAFLRATVNRGQPLAEADLHRLLDYAEGRSSRDGVILAALESFCAGMSSAVVGNGAEP